MRSAPRCPAWISTSSAGSGEDGFNDTDTAPVPAALPASASPRQSASSRRAPMSTEKNVQTVKDFFAAIGRGDKEGLLALVAEDIEWIIPREDWPLAGTHR